MTQQTPVSCPSCTSQRIRRIPGEEHSGPTDMCMDCGRSWAHKPGSVTASMLRTKNAPVMTSEFGKAQLAKKD